MKKVTRRAWRMCSIRCASHRSTWTAVAPSSIGITKFQVKPAWWVVGEPMAVTSSPPSPRTSAWARFIAYRVLWLWTTPFGSPVVPEVNMIWAGSSGPASRPSSEASSSGSGSGA
ncbi:hypothetical protein GA0115235_12099 [Streptomyces sp. DpondAA-F4a]|nr:hypothetical protein GA0115235_12099 [Streptomyces sp. DpondAA-F4a]